MRSILVIEKSATLRHALQRLLAGRGWPVTLAATYEDGLQALAGDAVATRFAAIVVGLAPQPQGTVPQLLTSLTGPAHRDLPVVVITHAADPALFGWVTRRGRSALLLWDDYGDCVGCLTKLLEPTQSTEGKACNTGSDDIRVLFVDDSRTVRAAYSRLLHEHGYLVETADNAAEALEQARRTPFDIAIVDYFMPGGNGDVLCRQLRDDPQTAGITTAIITGTYLDEVIRESLEAGAVECMFKNEANELFLVRLAAMSRSIRTKKSVETERQRLESILSSVGEGVYGVNNAGQITFINPIAKAILGFADDDDLIGRSAHKMFHYAHEDGKPNPPETCFLHQAYGAGDELRAWQTVFWHRSVRPVPVECTVFPLWIKGRLDGSVVAFRDVSERQLMEKELLWQANHDSLTHLYNRNYFERQLEDEVRRVRRSREHSALLYIDLDRFKYINDTAGHAAGDQLLIELSEQLHARMRDADLLARLGGDEFAIILRNVDEHNLHAAAECFREVLEQYNFGYGGRNYKVNGSIGVAPIDTATPSAGDALANADIACHVAKARGRNQTHVYRPESDEKVAMDLELGWSARLQEALRTDAFVLHYQPIVAIDGGKRGHTVDPGDATHYEVLVRLPDGTGGVISPNAFLPTAERFGLMPQIDVWVLTRAVEELARLEASRRRVTFSVNISGQTLDPESFIRVVKELLGRHAVDARSLIFEITETSAIENIDSAKRVIHELHALGCRFALDDFGSGFSSFYHLKHLPVDFIKIDGQFVRGMVNDLTDRAIVASINDIAHSFGKRTIAEFVEDPVILDMLQSYGVDFAQGHYISMPQAELMAVTECIRGIAGNR